MALRQLPTGTQPPQSAGRAAVGRRIAEANDKIGIAKAGGAAGTVKDVDRGASADAALARQV